MGGWVRGERETQEKRAFEGGEGREGAEEEVVGFILNSLQG